MPQCEHLPCGDIICRPVHPVGTAPRPRGDVACLPMRLAGAACQPRRPNPWLARQVAVVAAPSRAPHMSSSPRIANVQDQPHVAVAPKCGQTRRQGGGGKAIGRWFRRPPSIVQEQRVRLLGDGRPPHRQGVDNVQPHCGQPPGVYLWQACRGGVGDEWPPVVCKQLAR